MAKFLFLIFLALSFPVGAISQTTELPCSFTIAGNSVAQLVAIDRTGGGTSYSLTATIKTEMKLSDGNIISGFTTSRQATDSQGRTRVDDPSICAMDKDHQPRWVGTIMVRDPVVKTQTSWSEGSSSLRKIATVTHVPSLTISNPPTAQQEFRMAQPISKSYDRAGSQGGQDSERVGVEDLGTRNLAGLEASGMRITRTLPPGMSGNSLPLTYVEEKWVSDEYRVILLDIKDDPVLGKSTYEVTNFTPGEPDASLFQPPADYTVNDRTATQ